MTFLPPSTPDSLDGFAALEAAGAALAERADALAAFAADCDRWGLAEEALEARLQARRDRVAALISTARSAALRHRANPSAFSGE